MGQVVTTQSWFSRLARSFIGILIGIGMVIGGIVLIFWNENNGLRIAQSLEQAGKTLIVVEASPINPANNDRIVYLTGQAYTQDILEDKFFNISATALKLKRKVEMYQWSESEETRTEKEFGGSEKTVTTYSYNPVWSEQLIKSNQFHEPAEHQNPASMPVESKEWMASHVKVGDFELPASLIEQVDVYNDVDLKTLDLTKLKDKFHKPVSMIEDGLYVGDDSQIPKIGDIKVSITAALPQPVSIIAKQWKNTLMPYQAPAGREVNILVSGKKSPEAILQDKLSENSIWMWVLRFGAFILLFIGFCLILQPLQILADIIPFVGSIVGFGIGLVALMTSLLIWSMTLGAAWLVVRPVWSGIIIAITIVICFWIYKLKRKALQ